MANRFPNMFMIAQPGSPSIRSQVLVSIEQHVDWIFDMLEHAHKADVVEIEASTTAEDAWTRHVADVAAKSLFARADTQYVGANIPGKPRVYLAYLGGVGVDRKICDTVCANTYEGFILKREASTLPGSGAGQARPKRPWYGVPLYSIRYDIPPWSGAFFKAIAIVVERAALVEILLLPRSATRRTSPPRRAARAHLHVSVRARRLPDPRPHEACRQSRPPDIRCTIKATHLLDHRLLVFRTQQARRNRAEFGLDVLAAHRVGRFCRVWRQRNES